MKWTWTMDWAEMPLWVREHLKAARVNPAHVMACTWDGKAEVITHLKLYRPPTPVAA